MGTANQVEAELTAFVHDPAGLHAELSRRAVAETCTYADTYYDDADRGLAGRGLKLRVRRISTGEVLLTFKEPAIDADGSKPEHETTAGSAETLHTVFTALGLRETAALTKHCTNYRFTHDGRALLATVAEIAELPGRTFLELECVTGESEVREALQAIKQVLGDLGLHDLSTVSYLKQISGSAGRSR
ncbi:class IV adenylate cyclase [Amycolatopsis minnesotensis]|uniref:CYTH domain-containing protein n=1 Tax=Amycolatopsis minnesotensis TaxID=337894 RepID=A0ABP5BL25_9PSEU